MTEFNKLLLSFLLSSVANWLYKFALPLIILDKTGSAYHAASVFGVSFIPWILFSLLGGSLADALHKKYILFFGMVVSAILTVVLIFALIPAQLSFSLIYLVVFLLASVDPLTHPSFQSLIPELTDESELVKANASIQTIENILSILGPLIGGAVVALLSAPIALWINVLAFSLSAVSISFIKVASDKVKMLNLSQLWQSIWEGSRYAFGQKVILSGSVMFLFTNFALNMFEANFMYYMTRSLHLTAFMTGVSMTIAGIGALLAGLLAGQIVPKFPAGKLLATSTFLAGLFTILLFFSHTVWTVGIVLAVVSFFGTINVITYFSLRQRTVPKLLLGRVVAVTRMISYASIPIGAWVGGYLLQFGWTMGGIILLAGSLRLLAGVGAWISPLGREM